MKQKHSLLRLEASPTEIIKLFVNTINNSSGGIFIYRNCGERGAIRHLEPKYNLIINNTFTQNAVGVYVGSRNPVNPTYYCDYDKGYPFGSRSDDSDNAKFNVIMQNQFVKISPARAIFMTEHPNYKSDNLQIKEPLSRKSGCFYKSSEIPPSFFKHGDSFISAGKERICSGGRWTTSTVAEVKTPILREPAQEKPLKQRQVLEIDCSIKGDSKGCLKSVSCPSNLRAKFVRASCNLEWGEVNEMNFAKSSWNEVTVTRPSKRENAGLFQVTTPDKTINLVKGKTSLESLLGSSKFQFFCREVENSNGGDCHVRAQVVCE